MSTGKLWKITDGKYLKWQGVHPYHALTAAALDCEASAAAYVYG